MKTIKIDLTYVADLVDFDALVSLENLCKSDVDSIVRECVTVFEGRRIVPYVTSEYTGWGSKISIENLCINIDVHIQDITLCNPLIRAVVAEASELPVCVEVNINQDKFNDIASSRNHLVDKITAILNEVL